MPYYDNYWDDPRFDNYRGIIQRRDEIAFLDWLALATFFVLI